MFESLDVIRKYFAYKIHVKTVYEDGNRKSVLDILRAQFQCAEPFSLLRSTIRPNAHI